MFDPQIFVETKILSKLRTYYYVESISSKMSTHFFAPSKVASWNQHLEKKIIENIRSHSVSKGF